MLSALAGAVIALAACNSGRTSTSTEEVAAPAAPAAAPTAPAAAPTASPGTRVVTLDEPKIDLPKQESFQLLDPGTGARAQLRYALAAGTSKLVAESRVSMRHLDQGAFSSPVALPAIRDGFTVTIAADRPGKLALVPLPGEAAATSAAAEAYLASWRTLLQNRRITVAFDDRGAFSSISFNDDPTGARSDRAKDELVQRLLSLIVPLPAEPVGNGARWRVVTILRQASAYVKQTATYTLTSRGPAGWKLHAKLQRVGEQQRLTDATLPAGTTADLIALFRELDGDIELDPKLPFIASGSFTVESRLHVKLQHPGQTPAQGVEDILEDTGTVALSHSP